MRKIHKRRESSDSDSDEDTVYPYVKTNVPSGIYRRQDSGHEQRKCIKRELVIDSRDRDLVAYPSANRFDSFLGENLKNLKSVELTSILVPIVAGFTDRYIVLVESHCEDAAIFADRVGFGQNTATATYKTGCTFPRGVVANVMMVPNAFTNTAVYWQANNIGKGWKCKLRGDATNIDRLSFSLWSWDSSGISVPYGLPTEVAPAVGNNIVMTFRMHYH